MKLKKGDCSNCNNGKQGRAYIDSKTGLLCISLEEKYEKPKGLKVLVPYVCTTCGNTEWRALDSEEDGC